MSLKPRLRSPRLERIAFESATLHQRRSSLSKMLRRPNRRLQTLFATLGLLLFYLVFLVRQVELESIGAMGAMGRSATPMARLTRLAAVESPKKNIWRSAIPPVALPESVERVRDAQHAVRNGMLHVDPASNIHPIYQLIRDARREWDSKLARQSSSLKEAVEEYQRRYGRAPPLGFDKWWHYVVDNNVLLPDEYDQVDRDIAVFYALSPADIKKRLAKAAGEKGTFTFKVADGAIIPWDSDSNSDDKVKLHRERREGQLSMLAPIAQYLPDQTIVYSVHDAPLNFVSHAHKAHLLEHVEEGRYFDDTDKTGLLSRGHARACSPNSPLASFDEKAPLVLPGDSPAEKSFIVDHLGSMDPCTHPALVRLHGFMAGKNPVARELSAKFSISKTTHHADVLGIPTERVVSDLQLVPWVNKTISRLLWRGSNTGMHYAKDLPWQDTQRVRLMALGAADNNGNGNNGSSAAATVLSPPGLMGGKSVQASVLVQDKKTANAAYFDMGFVGRPIQCEKADGTCDEIASNYPHRERVERDEADKHKFVVDIDGNGWSARFQRLLWSGSLVFKSTVMPEWYNDRIQPWVHYVPIKLDYTDLRDAMAFFVGDDNGHGGRDDIAEHIGMSGREWAGTFYRYQDMVAYVFRLYLEWGRLQAPDREAMAFKYDPSMERVRT